MNTCCCIDVDDPCAIMDDQIVTARKSHKCCECGCDILPGKKYENTSALAEGKWYRYKTCAPCAGIRNTFFSCGWYWGQMREDFYECQGWDYLGQWSDKWEDE